MKWKAMIALGGFALSAASGAFAAIAVDTANSGNAEVFFAVWDISGDKTYVQDLGVSARGTDWSTYSHSFTLDSSTYNSIFTGSSPSDLRWGVFAGSTITGSSQDLFFTSGSSLNVNNIFTSETNFTDVSQNIFNLRDLANAHNAGSTDYTLNLATKATSGQGAIGNLPGSVFNGSLQDDVNPIAAFSTIGQALKFFRIGFDAAGFSQGMLDVRQAFLSWAFDGTTLSYNVSAVPLPAGIWLLGSALLGLVGVSRRRQAAMA